MPSRSGTWVLASSERLLRLPCVLHAECHGHVAAARRENVLGCDVHLRFAEPRRDFASEPGCRRERFDRLALRRASQASSAPARFRCPCPHDESDGSLPEWRLAVPQDSPPSRKPARMRRGSGTVFASREVSACNGIPLIWTIWTLASRRSTDSVPRQCRPRKLGEARDLAYDDSRASTGAGRILRPKEWAARKRPGTRIAPTNVLGLARWAQKRWAASEAALLPKFMRPRGERPERARMINEADVSIGSRAAGSEVG